MRARYYNSEIKRFINRDVIQGSILESQTFNRYAYVNGNPISYIDPFGLSRDEDSSLLVNVWNFIIGDDINTLADSNASALEKVWAGVSIASNFIPGAGPAFKGLKVLTKGSKLLSKGSRKADDIADYIKPCPMNCFVAGTLIETSEGKKTVEDIQIGDKVLAKDDKTGDIAYKEVVDLFNRIAYKTYIISIGETKITVTGEHPFWVQDKGWVETKDLETGDILTTYDGQELPIDDILVKEEKVTVYNFEVADYHTYFVSELAVWTHNCTRLIPGTVGVVTGGSSKKLGENIFLSMGLKAGTTRTGYQAQHIIPSQMRKHPLIKKIGMDLDDSSNGIFLREPFTGVSTMSTHKGFHSPYNQLVKRELDKININQDVDLLVNEVYNLQSKLRILQEKGMPLYSSPTVTKNGSLLSRLKTPSSKERRKEELISRWQLELSKLK